MLSFIHSIQNKILNNNRKKKKVIFFFKELNDE